MTWEPYILVLLLIVIDYITGVIYAIKDQSFDSTIMRQGLWHKVSYLVVIVVGYIIDRLCAYYDLDLFYSGSILALIIVWVVLTEIGSILENLVKINPKFSDNAFMKIFTKKNEGESK